MAVSIAPELALAHRMAQRPGVYALLLGSGVSRSAGIPTGWEIIIDLCRRIAALEDKNPLPEDPIAWFTETKGKAPTYSDLVNSLAPNPGDQRRLLSPFFEATPKDRDSGRKLPTKAHRAVARLMQRGTVKIVLTTNFDRLLEDALSELGVHPIVIDTVDKINGMEPLAHSGPTIIKLHGDYLDLRVRNSAEALSSYEPPLDRLLDQIFDEYGLVIAGWSGEWDTALRRAIERAPSRRYATVWVTRGAISDAAKKLAELRAAEIATAAGADEFFDELARNVENIASIGRADPVSVEAAIAELKRCIRIGGDRSIELHDLIMREAVVARDRLNELFQESYAKEAAELDILNVTTATVAAMERLCQLAAHAAFHEGDRPHDVWAQASALILESTKSTEFNGYNPARLPIILLAYAIGIPSVVSGRLRLFQRLLSIRAPIPSGTAQGNFLLLLRPNRWISNQLGQKLLPPLDNGQTYNTPVSEYLDAAVRPWFLRLLHHEKRWSLAFDEFEILLCLLILDLTLTESGFEYEYPFRGTFSWRAQEWERRNVWEALKAPADYAPLKAGFFGNQPARLTAAEHALKQFLARTRTG